MPEQANDRCDGLRKKISCCSLLAFVFTFFGVYAFAQTLYPSIKQYEETYKRIDQLQNEILKITMPVEKNNSDSAIHFNTSLKNALTTRIDSFVHAKEADTLLMKGEELLSLHSCELALMYVLYALKTKDIKPTQISEIIDDYLKIQQMIAAAQPVLPNIQKNKLATATILGKAIREQKVVDEDAFKTWLLRSTLSQNPSRFFNLLFDFPNVSCADSLIVATAPKLPDDLYTYSQASHSALGKRIQSSADSLIRLICTITSIHGARQCMPFLDDLYHKKLSFNTIKTTLQTGNPVLYYQLLVKTQIGYTERLNRKDTPIAYELLSKTIDYKALNNFIYHINELHEYNDQVRLKVLNKLTAQDLYYLCIAGVNELYTSSFLKIYSRMFTGEQKQSFAFLQHVHFHHFRRFLKMAATFNTLDNFLSRMSKAEADSVVHAFIAGLNGGDNLQDAIDVADAYASIRNENLRRFILQDVKEKLSYTKPKNEDTSRPDVYKILYTLFMSMDTANRTDLASSLHIAPVYQLNNQLLRDDSGRIVIQQFFYGDKDGIQDFNIFLNACRNRQWKITDHSYWVSVISTSGIPVHIYCNKPLDNDTYQDVFAQQQLQAYLQAFNLHPSIIIHRGHSYHVGNTISQLTATNKLIILGSCGGYTRLKQVFDSSPTAHIISTKQEGTITINQPMLMYLIGLLKQGKNLDWPAVWKKLETDFKGNSRFDDYIPPYQNLGGILMMAYLQQIANATTH